MNPDLQGNQPGYMTLQNLALIHAKSFEIKEQIQDAPEEWVQDKISSIADDIQEVVNYLNHKTASLTLAKIANTLDQQGDHALASQIDTLLEDLCSL